MSCRPPGRRGFTLIEMLVVIAIIGVLIALSVASSSISTRCRSTNAVHTQSNASMLGMETYESSFEGFPYGVVNAGGPIQNVESGYHMSWISQMLPFVDQKNTFNHLNFDFGAYSLENHTVRTMKLATFSCPADPESMQLTLDGFGQSSFVGAYNDSEVPINSDNNGLLYLNGRIRLEDIPDGASQTILLGEAKSESTNFGWISGTRATLRNGGTAPNALLPAPSKTNPKPIGGFSSYHSGGVNYAMADGSVRFMTNGISKVVLARLINRNDGEMINAGSY